MRLARFFLLLCILAPATALGSAGVPLTLGGITLGQDISEYAGICLQGTDSVLRGEPHLNEVNIDPARVPGIINGKIAYANCGQKGKIVRVKFRFSCPERSLFEMLRNRYKKRFGTPAEWRGDPFKNVLSWKWSLEDNAGNRISLVLSHTRDEDYNTLNAVKMTLRSLWEEAHACMRAKSDAYEKRTTEMLRKANQIDLDLFTPK